MKTTVQLDYQAIVANQAQPVHLAFQFTAPGHTGRRDQPIAFSVVLDRSGSMFGDPLQAALRASKTVVQNLRREDQFSLVTFEDTAQVVIPMGPITAKQAVLDRIDQIGAGGSTNLTGGWMLGRDELRNTPAGTIRRELLLTDGCLNIGIVEPTQVNQVVMGGLERDGIRTSTLGFGNSYDEDLLSGLAQKTGGTFYDANDADKLPEIFEAELDGLQKITVQNLRLRFKRLHFVDAIRSLGGYQELTLPDGRRDYSIGDLTADEERVAVFALEVLPIPLVAGTQTPAASIDGEVLAELEILYDEITAEGVTSQVESHQIRVRPTQSQADVQVNREVLPWVSAQQAAEIVNQAIVKRDAEDIAGARQLLEAGIARLKAYGLDDQISDGIQLLQDALKKLENPDDYIRSRKIMRSVSACYAKMSSSDFLNIEESTPAPSFEKPRPNAAEPIVTPPPADPQPEPDNRTA
jgi:Ca-activated chloride channel family protein